MRKSYKLLLMCLCSHLSLAQDSIKTTILKEVVTTASRYDQSIIEAPRSVTVISNDVIQKRTFNSVGEILTTYAGIYVVGANQTPGSSQSLFMRGANSNQVAVMIDGVRINDPSSPNAALDLNELSLTNVDRIEIIRGSHGTLYGGAAVGGVINIITKKSQKAGLHGDITAQAGTFGESTATLSESAGLTYSMANGLYLNGSLFNQNVRGLNASLDTVSSIGAFHNVDQDNFQKTDAYVKAGFKNSRWDGFVSYKKTDQHADIDDGVYNDDDNAFLEFKRDFVNYQIASQLTKKIRLSGLGSWSNSKRVSVNDSSLINDKGEYDATFVNATYRGMISTNEIQLNYRTEKVIAIAGGGRYGEDMNFNTYYFNRSIFGEFISIVNYDTLDTSSATNYVFAQINFAQQNFNLVLGSRWNYHSMFGDYWTFEANPSYYFDNTLLYASLSTGFNPPSLYQLFDPSKTFNAYGTRGNSDLRPEESTSVEVGIKKDFQGGSYVTLSAYRTETRNAIEYVYLWNKNTPVENLTFVDNMGDTYLNIAKQVVNGVELEGSAVIGKFTLHGNLSWLDGAITMDPADIDTQKTGGNHVQLFNYGTFVTDEIKVDELVRRPRFTANAEAIFNAGATLTISGGYRYTGSRFDSGYDESLGPYGALNQFKVKQYNLVDIGMNWQIMKSLMLGMRVENIFDASYQEIIGFQTRGRSAYIKLNYQW